MSIRYRFLAVSLALAAKRVKLHLLVTSTVGRVNIASMPSAALAK